MSFRFCNYFFRFVLLFSGFFILQQKSFGQTQRGNDIDGKTAGEQAGTSVSMPDANTVAIGAPRNSQGGTNAGMVSIYQWNGTGWVQKGNDIIGEAVNDFFGFSVSMPDANTVAVGAYANDGNGTNSGHVRIYNWDGTAWVQKGVDIDGEATGDYSGYSVSMPDANTVAIGAPRNDETGGNVGHARVYTWNGTSWIQLGSDINGESADDRFGTSVSMPDANTLAVGAIYNDGNGAEAGQVRIYLLSNSNWIQKGIDIDGDVTEDNFGYSVSMPDANTVAIGAINHDFNQALNSGQVKMYYWNGGSWLQKGNEIKGLVSNDLLGSAISMPNENTVAVGAPLHDGGGMTNVGEVYIFRFVLNAGGGGGEWVQETYYIRGEAATDFFGSSVSMPDDFTVAMGAIENDGNGANAGHVRVYGVPGGLPVVFGAINASYGNKILDLNFTTTTETNNDHFIVEASTNGIDFMEIGSIDSKTKDGNSSSSIVYSVRIDLSNTLLYSTLLLSFLFILPFSFSKRSAKWMWIGFTFFALSFLSCNKTIESGSIDFGNLYFRIAQVDKDGGKNYSKIIKVKEL